MLKIKVMPFNPFQVNTYLLYDETGECIIIDAACYEPSEEIQLESFLAANRLRPVGLLLTHGHIDHILGNNFITEKYGLKPQMHKDGRLFIENAPLFAENFGFKINKQVLPEKYLQGGQVIDFGNQKLMIIETPGHANGSVCFLNQDNKFVITGDVLFNGSIGRTDLPTGDLDTLIRSIKEQLLCLDDDVVVYPGHGPSTTIGTERIYNPYLQKIFQNPS